MTQEILVIYGMIERHLIIMAKHKACYFTGSQNYASLNEELIVSVSLTQKNYSPFQSAFHESECKGCTHSIKMDFACFVVSN